MATRGTRRGVGQLGRVHRCDLSRASRRRSASSPTLSNVPVDDRSIAQLGTPDLQVSGFQLWVHGLAYPNPVTPMTLAGSVPPHMSVLQVPVSGFPACFSRRAISSVFEISLLRHTEHMRTTPSWRGTNHIWNCASRTGIASAIVAPWWISRPRHQLNGIAWNSLSTNHSCLRSFMIATASREGCDDPSGDGIHVL